MCQDHDMLTNRYDAELRVYANAVRDLESAIGPGFAAASKRVDRALLAFENARDRVSEHIRSHRCDALGDR
jgi:hypothetical protein